MSLSTWRLLMGPATLGLVLASCRTSDPSAVKEKVAVTSVAPNYDFCNLSRTATPNSAGALTWNAARVQVQIKELLTASSIKSKPWAAYPALYLRMTRERDKERCGGRLQPESVTSQFIGDRLADIMSRFYVLETAECANKEALRRGAGFCGLMRKSLDDQYDALSMAMASTAIYISSHIAQSLRAIVGDEPFWQALGEPQALHADRELAMSRRIALLKDYRKDFDRFNGFLADQIATVVAALDEEGLLRTGALGLAGQVAKHISFRSCFFGKIRDMAFATAVLDAAEFGAREHPMLERRGGAYAVHSHRYDYSQKPTPREQKLEEFALEAVAGPAQRLIYKHLLGGKTWDELKRSGEIAPVSCPED